MHIHLNVPWSSPMTDFLLDPAHCVSGNLHKTARAVSRLYADAMRPAGLARSQFAVLGHLERLGPVPVSELADRLYMERTTLTRNLSPLVDGGLVDRQPSPQDARVKLVAITDAGRAKLAEARGYWREAQARMLDSIGEDAWRKLEDQLRQLRRMVR
ncbi:MAG: MarR family winged helix-turn-helix transcriptional regulator [Pseudomonadales bacterium]